MFNFNLNQTHLRHVGYLRMLLPQTGIPCAINVELLTLIMSVTFVLSLK